MKMRTATYHLLEAMSVLSPDKSPMIKSVSLHLKLGGVLGLDRVEVSENRSVIHGWSGKHIYMIDVEEVIGFSVHAEFDPAEIEVEEPTLPDLVHYIQSTRKE
jgi:hypothetical protein